MILTITLCFSAFNGLGLKNKHCYSYQNFFISFK